MSKNIKNYIAKLRMRKIAFSNIKFERNLVDLDNNEFETLISATVIEKENGDSDERLFLVKLATNITNNKNEFFKLDITLDGLFSIDTDMEFEQFESLIKKNTVAILFPFLRSQISIMTSQPSMEPIVLEAVNINAMFTENEEK